MKKKTHFILEFNVINQHRMKIWVEFNIHFIKWYPPFAEEWGVIH